jgi:hypothetical protein
MKNAGSADESDFHEGNEHRPARRAKRKLGLVPALALAVAASGLGGCSTPGPGHAYLYSPALGSTIRDLDPRSGAERDGIPAFVNASEQVLGFAYDPYTDHLFIRLFPGNHVRVVDRPAGAVKRTFRAPNLPMGGRDLAVRSRNRHLFFTDPTAPALFETDGEGGLKGYHRLEGLDAPVWGVAHDPATDELIVLPEERSSRVLRFDLAGRSRGELRLDAAVEGVSLGYDAAAREYFASLADGSAIAVFDERGRLLRRLPRPAPGAPVFVDVGPRSLLRLF